jgi:NAD(P)H-dependent FMN reductase
MTRVLAVSGSLRRASMNSGLVRAAAEHAPEGVEVEIYEDLAALPAYNEDYETDGLPAALRRRIAEADALFISTPEFNGTMPGALKQVVDWGSRPYGVEAPLYSKPVAVAGVSVTDYGAVWAQDHLRKALGIAGARVLDAELTVGGAKAKFDDAGNLTDPEISGRLAEVLDELVAHHRALAA